MTAMAVYVWTRRSLTGAYALFGTLVSVAYLLLFGAAEERSTTLAGHVFWQHVQIPGYAAMPVCCLLLALTHSGRPLRGWRAAALFAVPAGGVLLHWTDAWHHLYWRLVWIDRTGPAPIMGRTYGPGFWVVVTYSYLMIAGSVLVLVDFLLRSRAQRKRTVLFLVAVSVPCAASILYVFDWFPVRYLDITPYALTITGVCMVWVIFRDQFQAIVPVAARAVVNSMADGVIVLDLDARVADLNPAAEALLGCSREPLIGQYAAAALRSHADLLPYLEGGGPMAGDALLQSGNGCWLCAATAVEVMSGRRRIGRVISLRDVTAERRASEELLQARQLAEAAAIAKSRFLATMSHEIRTPMNGVVGAAELLLDSGLNDEQTELVRTAQESAHSLLSIINDILDFSKIDAGKLTLEQIPFDLCRLMDQVVRLLRPVANKKGLELKLRIAPDTPRVIVGDPTRIRQVMLNLVGNGIKFTAKGWVALEVGRVAAESRETRIAIVVEDTGIGIAPDRIAALFQEFSQADSSVTRNFGGTGLGLAISQRLVEKMGGSIRVESTLGCGSRFIVETPVRLGQAGDVDQPAPAPFAESQTSPGCRVLLAEDNLVNQKIGQRILEKLGCQVRLAANGREAMESAISAPYDVILMDLHMPEVDGFESTREIRLRGIRTPIVALTASVEDETREACEAAGMDAFITKPIRVDEISSILKRFRA
jgi:PAS domain S-box-containing protein